MTQSELNRAVSEATGEDVNEISLRGFSLVDPVGGDLEFEAEQFAAQVYDWDARFTGTTQPFYESF